MFDRLVEEFCQFDDFCLAFDPRWDARLLTQGAQSSRKPGPEAGLADSEIMTILVLYHSSHFKNFKTFYQGVVLALLRPAFPKAPCYARFIALTRHVWMPLTFCSVGWDAGPAFTISTAHHFPSATIAGSTGTGCSSIWPGAAKPASAKLAKGSGGVAAGMAR
jgi:hypothetical protein